MIKRLLIKIGEKCSREGEGGTRGVCFDVVSERIVFIVSKVHIFDFATLTERLLRGMLIAGSVAYMNRRKGSLNGMRGGGWFQASVLRNINHSPLPPYTKNST